MNQHIVMNKILTKNRLPYLSVIPLLCALTACQTLRPPKLPDMPAQMVSSTSSDTTNQTTHAIRFNITGKIGVRTSKQSGSAFYAWSQDGERFAIDLTGALGIGQTHIEGIPNHVSLQSAKTGYIEASTPEELLQRATGWQAPISYLPHWINGESVDTSSPVTRDQQHRLLTLNEGGWDVIFTYDDQTDRSYPSKLVMTQTTTAQPEQPDADRPSNRVILTIQREITAPSNQSTPQTTPSSTTP